MQLVVISINSVPVLRNRDNTTYNKEELVKAGLNYYHQVKPLLLRTLRQVCLTHGVEFNLRQLPHDPLHVIENDTNAITLEFGIDFQFTLKIVHELRNYLRIYGHVFKRPLLLDEHTE